MAERRKLRLQQIEGRKHTIRYAVRVSSSRLDVVPSSDLDTLLLLIPHPDVSPVACLVPIVSPPIAQSLCFLSDGPSHLCLLSVSVSRISFEYMIPVSTVTAKRTYTFCKDASRHTSTAECHTAEGVLTSECYS